MAAPLFGVTNRIGFLSPHTFHLFIYRWRASQLIKSLPASDLPQVRAKVAAMEMLKGQRADLGLQRAWEGNYLASVCAGEQSGIYSCSLLQRKGRIVLQNLAERMRHLRKLNFYGRY